MKAKWFRVFLIVTLLVIAIVPIASAAPVVEDEGPLLGSNSDNPSHPLGAQQAALRQAGLESKLNGKTNGNVHEVAKGQFVELALEDTDKIFVVIAEFDNYRHPAYPDGGSDALTFDGPLHNSIPEPDRSVDNSTLWQADYNRAHYEDMYFNRMADYYQDQSSGRYTVEGAVTEWVKVPYNEARYGRDACGSIVCSNTWQLIRHAINIWVADQLAAGMSQADVNAYLQSFDEWDRYDYDGDGNFDERDGYIDHFQIVHAGGDQAAGDPQQGTDAIWSHRWYVNTPGIGVVGPVVDGNSVPFGGYEIGGAIPASPVIGGPNLTFPTNPTGVWVGDYTIQPENGGLGVFAHEYAHDLGLPDLYDTSGNTCVVVGACENSTGFWTLMSSGANIGDGAPDGIGDAPVDMGVWEKFQLGWLNYEVAFAGAKSEHKLGPSTTNTKQAQGLFVVLPDKEVISDIAEPYSGSFFYYSGAGDDLDNSMSRSVTLPAGASLSAKVNYQIELDWDYAYLTVNGTAVHTNLSTNTSPNGQNFGEGITGSSGGNWVDLTADLSAFAGQTVDIGFRYWTDAAVVEPGFMVDDLAITGQPLDDAESDFGWTFDGFRVTTGSETTFHFNAYVAEFRQYRGNDASLQTAYNFGFLDSAPDWVEFFPYQDGLLISYWDNSQSDNSTGAHPGEGLILPIDAHPTAMIRADGGFWRNRMQTYDSTFSFAPTDAITLHWLSQPSFHASQPGVSVFNDAIQYWNPLIPTAGVMNPHTGTTIRIKSISAQGGFMQVAVNK